MNARVLLVGLFATTFGAAALGAGCGGSESDNTVTDAGGGDTSSDVKQNPIEDASPDDSATACVDADLNNINVPDASLGDAGGSVGLCVACSQSNCSALIAECNADCDCRNAAVDFYNCVGGGGQLLACGVTAFGGLTGKTAQTGQDLGLCIYAGCKDKCGLPDLDGGFDASQD